MVRLPSGMSRLLDEKLEALFDRLKLRALGPHFVKGRHLYVSFHRALSLPGIYEQAVSDEGGIADTETVDHLARMTNDFLDQHKATAKAHVRKRILDFMQEIKDGSRPKGQNPAVALEGVLSEVFENVTNSVKRVVETQTQHAQTIGIKDGIDQINAKIGVTDPVVFFAPVRDDRLCDECKKVHLLPDEVIPRVWKSSEVKSGYHERGEDRPSWSLMHPHCRCALTTLLPGYGFDGAGRVTFKGQGWDEYGFQRK